LDTLIGLLSARPLAAQGAEPGTTSGTPDDELVRLINERIAPLTPVTAPDVHIRALRLVSDEVNDHGGRFPLDEHERLCELLIDTPVLVGHDRTRLRVARNFAARAVATGGSRWVEVWLYWRRGSGPHQDQLAADIDAGVVKEGSIGFEFRRPQCSICGRDIRTCEHIPDQEYADAHGVPQIAHYEYREIVRVLETSLVYRGATRGTHFTRDAAFCKSALTPPGTRGLGPLPTEAALRDAGPAEPIVLSAAQYLLVLDRRRASDGRYRYIVARRDPSDATVCDELILHAPQKFAVGDRVIRRHGSWQLLASDDCAMVHPASSFRSGLAWRPTLLRVRRSPRSPAAARLRLLFGTGCGRGEGVAA